MSKTPKHWRNRELYNAHQAGVGMTEIGRRYGITRGRVEAIVKRIAAMEKLKASPDHVCNHGITSVRALNALSNIHIETLSDARRELAAGRLTISELRKVPNCGEVTIAEINEAFGPLQE